MTIDEMMVKVEDAIEALKEALEELGAIHEDPEVPVDPEVPEWSWAGEVETQPKVLGTFPAGIYEFNLNLDVPRALIGKKKDFRLLLIDELGKGRGQDREAQFHVENGADFSTLYFGGHAHLGGASWPGTRLDIESNLGRGYWDLQTGPDEDLRVHVESEFALVLGELVTHDRGRVTSPAGASYEITMRRVG